MPKQSIDSKNKVKDNKINKNFNKKINKNINKKNNNKIDEVNQIKKTRQSNPEETSQLNTKENNQIKINIHPNFNNYLLDDIKYIKSTTIKEILKTLKLDSETFRKLESYLNKEITIN